MSVLDIDVQEAVEALAKKGYGSGAIVKKLKNRRMVVARSTVARYMQKFKKIVGPTRVAVKVTEFEQFSKAYFPHDMTFAPAAFHEEIRRLIIEHQHVVIAAPRSFAKSTISTKHYPIWLALNWKEQGRLKAPDIMVVSATGTLAKERLAIIRAEFEDNGALINSFSKQRSDTWRQDEIRLANGAIIRAKGAGYQTRGFRPTDIIVDDIEEDEAVLSDMRRKKLKDWFYKALFNTLEPTAKLIIVGTFIHPLALLPELVNNPPEGFVTRKYVALDKEGNSTWPEKWPLEELERRRKIIGDERFASEFMNSPIPSGDNPIVKRDWLIKNFLEDQPRSSDMRIVIGVDPAVGKSKNSDESGICVAGKVKNRDHFNKDHVYVLSARRGQWTAYELAKQLIQEVQRFKPQTVVLETVFWQDVIKQIVLKEFKKAGVEVSIKAVKPRADKVHRLQSIVSYIQNGYIHLKEGQRDLFDQLAMFPHARKDLADAFVHCVTELLVTDGSAMIMNPTDRLDTKVKREQREVAKTFPELDVKSWLKKPSVSAWH